MVTSWDFDNSLDASETEATETEEPTDTAEKSSKSPTAEEHSQAVAVPSARGNILHFCPVFILLNQAHPCDLWGKLTEKHIWPAWNLQESLLKNFGQGCTSLYTAIRNYLK